MYEGIGGEVVWRSPVVVQEVEESECSQSRPAEVCVRVRVRG